MENGDTSQQCIAVSGGIQKAVFRTEVTFKEIKNLARGIGNQRVANISRLLGMIFIAFGLFGFFLLSVPAVKLVAAARWLMPRLELYGLLSKRKRRVSINKQVISSRTA